MHQVGWNLRKWQLTSNTKNSQLCMCKSDQDFYFVWAQEVWIAPVYSSRIFSLRRHNVHMKNIYELANQKKRGKEKKRKEQGYVGLQKEKEKEKEKRSKIRWVTCVANCTRERETIESPRAHTPKRCRTPALAKRGVTFLDSSKGAIPPTIPVRPVGFFFWYLRLGFLLRWVKFLVVMEETAV